jgi:hypothetical protein
VDGDGSPYPTDCDDDDARLYPGATEIPYDGIDQDCDGSDLTDVDGDGYSSTEAGGWDCDDSDSGVHPGAPEVPYDGVDDDCDGTDLLDVDGDGFRGEEAGGHDCDDTDPFVHPGAPETPGDDVDSDCDGLDPALVSRTYIVADDSSYFYEDDYFRANIYKMKRDVFLEEFDVWMSTGFDCYVDFYVYERPVSWADWEVLWSVHHSRYVDIGWFWSTYIDIWLEEDYEYALGVGWNCPFAYFAQYGETIPDTPAFSFEGTGWDNSYAGYVGAAYIFPMETPVGAAYHQRITVAW